jgi:HSP20 family protein
MTLVKFRKPFLGTTNASSVIPSSPFADLLENFLGDSMYTPEYSSFVPAVNLSEDENEYLIELSASGFRKEDFKLEMNKQVMSISGTHEEEKEVNDRKFSRKEFTKGSFLRKFSLPDGANTESIEARYENGILKVHIAKLEEAKDKGPKEIRIS